MYLKTMEPPTYSYGRYIDWIKPYLTDTIQSSVRTQHLHSSKMELSLAMQALQGFTNLMAQPPFTPVVVESELKEVA